MKQNVYLASKPRYEILDGLRGVAAMLVVAFHLFETYSKGAPYQIINHGYLAVDFFFVLSGFVLQEKTRKTSADAGDRSCHRTAFLSLR